MKTNPFPVSHYISPKYFCDRRDETAMLLDAITNRRHLTMFSPRRIGKTALIKHVFFKGRRNKQFIPIYCDILATGSIKEFTECFGRAVLTTLASTESGLKKILRTLASLRPKAAIDPITGEPYISLAINNEHEAVDSLNTVFRYLRDQKQYFVLAIDEFQQVADYPEKNTEAVLRSFIQETINTSMIFSGSRKHLLTEIFSSPDRPFYSSTQMLEIGNINTNEYKTFIENQFRENGIKTDESALDLLLLLTSGHTFYVQYMCNRLFSSHDSINDDAVRKMLLRIINENESVYASYIAILTTLQFRVLRAIALNGGIRNPTSNDFLLSYGLGAASSVSLAIKSLTDKEFIDLNNNQYVLNDQFFNAWLRYKADVL